MTEHELKIKRPHSREFQRKRHPYEAILDEWLGNNLSSERIVKNLPEPVHIKDALDNLLNRKNYPENTKLRELSDKWIKIMGNELARISRPTSIKNRILSIEVDNSVILMQLKTFHKKEILEKISSAFDPDFCVDIKFFLHG